METPPMWGVLVASYQMIIIFLLPVILMSSSYYRVITALWRSTKNMTVLTNTRHMDPVAQDLITDVVSRPVDMKESGSAIYQARPFPVRTSFRPSPSHDKQITLDSASASFTRGLNVTDEKRGSTTMSRTTSQRTFIQQQSKSNQNKTKKINQSRKQIIKMLLVIILVFTACWCPRFLLNIIKWIAPMGEWEFNVSQPFYYFSRIAKLLPIIHAMLNPIIYR